MLTRNDCQKLCPLHVINLVQVRSFNFRDKNNLIGTWPNFNLKEIPHFTKGLGLSLGCVVRREDTIVIPQC